MTKNILNTFNCPIIFISSMTVYNSLKKTNLNEKLKIRLNKKRINTHIINLKQKD